MKLILCLFVLVLPNVCYLKETYGQFNNTLSNKFEFPKNRRVEIPDGRVIGGEEVTPHSYPFQAALVIYSSTSISFCGGTLISTQWVLTAAHCVASLPYLIVVTLGAHNLTLLAEETVVLNSFDFVIHENWNPSTLQNDVALVKLPENVTLNEYVNVVPFADGSETYANETGTVVGWGRTDVEATGISDILRRANATILSNEECAAINEDYQEVIAPTHLCLDGGGTVASCSGDSGGPLVVDGVQVGIVSFGYSDCISGPSVFTRLTSFHDWIVEHIGEEGGGSGGGGDDDATTAYRNLHYSLAVVLAFLLLRLFNCL